MSLGTKEQLSRIADFSQITAAAERLDDVWDALCRELATFGFSRALYARKPRGNRGNFHNLYNTLILSRYGPLIDDYFVKQRAFVEDHSTKWAVENKGVVSWQETRNRYLQDEMTQRERRVHEMTRSLGLVAGVTVGMAPSEATYISGIGLCIDNEYDQADADRIWAENATYLATLLDMFEGVVRHHIVDGSGKTPDENQMRVLNLILEGKSNREIGEILGVHRRTVETWLADVREELGVATTLQAVVTLSQRGLM